MSSAAPDQPVHEKRVCQGGTKSSAKVRTTLSPVKTSVGEAAPERQDTFQVDAEQREDLVCPGPQPQTAIQMVVVPEGPRPKQGFEKGNA